MRRIRNSLLFGALSLCSFFAQAADRFLCIDEFAGGLGYDKASRQWHGTTFKVSQKYIVRQTKSENEFHGYKWVVTNFGGDFPKYFCAEELNDVEYLQCKGLGSEFTFNRKNKRFVWFYKLGFVHDRLPGDKTLGAEGDNTPAVGGGTCSAID